MSDLLEKNVFLVREGSKLLIFLKFINIKKKLMVGKLFKMIKSLYFRKKFEFKNFLESQKFVNDVGKVSEEEGHHPDIMFGWGYLKINITTHAIEGLSENDFILAAKINQLISA